MLDVLSITFPIFCCIALGYGAVWRKLFRQEYIRALGKFVMNLALPALLFSGLAHYAFAEVFDPAYLVTYGTASLIVLGQYKDLVGYASALDTNKLFKAVDITLHAGSWEVSAAVVGAASIVVLVLLKRSPIKRWADTSSSSCWQRSLCFWSAGTRWSW